MLLPIGMLIYWIAKTEDAKGMLIGLWYYKENWVPTNAVQKRYSIEDFKQQRCVLLSIFGTFAQLSDILSQSDHFDRNSDLDAIKERFNALVDSIECKPLNTPVKFDDVHNIKGTALMVDTIIKVEESYENVMNQIQSKKGVIVQISESWSLAQHLKDCLE